MRPRCSRPCAGRTSRAPAAARSLPFAAAASTSRTSPLTPETPSRPEPWSSAVGQFVERQKIVAEQPQHHARVERACTRAHHQALERSEAHRRPDRPAAVDRRDRAAAAEVRDDQPKASPDLGPSSSRGAPHRPLDRQAVEAVAADAPFGVPLVRQGIQGSRSAATWRGRRCRRRRRAAARAAAGAAARIVSTATGLCSGARSESSSRSARTASSISVG